MGYSTDQLIGFMQQSEPIDDATRLKIFEFLSQRFSLIPLKGGSATTVVMSVYTALEHHTFWQYI